MKNTAKNMGPNLIKLFGIVLLLSITPNCSVSNNASSQ